MGFVKKNGVWERKSQLEDRAVDAPGPSDRHSSPVQPSSSSIPVPVPAPPAPAPSPAPMVDQSLSSSVGFSDIQLKQLKTLLDDQADRLKTEFDDKFLNLKETLYSLDDRITKIESTLSTSAESLSGDLKNIFEELKDICGDGETYAKSNAELQDRIQTACTFVDERLKDYVKIQCEGMKNIVDHLTRIVRRQF